MEKMTDQIQKNKNSENISETKNIPGKNPDHLNNKAAIIFVIILFAVGFWAIFALAQASGFLPSFNLFSRFAVLNPQGLIGIEERRLIILAILLMLIVVLPVFFLTIYFSWKYRESRKNSVVPSKNLKVKYDPNWDHNLLLELAWWALPLAIILTLAIITWKSSHDLDPFKAIASPKKPLTIQVVALDWKWLFIYPQQKIATVNFVEIPVGVPVDFQITSDAPMNSFWIPQLGGQIYAMSGMSTQLHLLANKAGDYAGSSANISGEGFASMNFDARAASENDFNNWVNTAKNSFQSMDMQAYDTLAQPSENNPVVYYALGDDNLYNEIVMKFMMPPLGENKN